MRTLCAIVLLGAGLAALCGCRRAGQEGTQTVEVKQPVVIAFSQYEPGDTLSVVQVELRLDRYEVRYRSAMPEGEMGMVYFLDTGNLHIDAKKIGSTWVIVSTPLLEPSTVPAADRVAEWDRAADAQALRSRSEQ